MNTVVKLLIKKQKCDICLEMDADILCDICEKAYCGCDHLCKHVTIPAGSCALHLINILYAAKTTNTIKCDALSVANNAILIDALFNTLDIRIIETTCFYFRIDNEIALNIIGKKLRTHITDRVLKCLYVFYQKTGLLPKIIEFPQGPSGYNANASSYHNFLFLFEKKTLFQHEIDQFYKILVEAKQFRNADRLNNIQQYYVIREVCIALFSITVKCEILPPYIVLSIIDFAIEGKINNQAKIRLIQNIWNLKRINEN